MAKTAVDKMKKLVVSLPLKDRDLAERFISERKFQELYEIIKSDIKKYESMPEDIRLFHIDVDIDGMNNFLAEVISYLNIIGWDYEIDDYDEEY